MVAPMGNPGSTTELITAEQKHFGIYIELYNLLVKPSVQNYPCRNRSLFV